jgi:NAD(P)-dependent dehydrogenase (short-subunit alcohol dehydrogenase family)
MRRPTALLIGASRGLGLALALEYLKRGWNVVATVRGTGRTNLHDATERFPERLKIENVDITDLFQILALRERLAGRSFDLLFVSAGIANGPEETINTVETGEFIRVMVTNAFGPMRVIETLGNLVQREGTIGVMSSRLGSVAANDTGGWEVYRGSKAALNTLMRSYAVRHKDDSRSLLLIAPGWVRTDMGGPNAALSIEESIPRVVDTIGAASGKRGLQYLDYRGETLPW